MKFVISIILILFFHLVSDAQIDGKGNFYAPNVISGGLKVGTQAKSASYSITVDDVKMYYFWDMTNGAVNDTITLPSASSIEGYVINVQKVDDGSGYTVIKATDLIQGQTYQTLQYQYMSVTIRSNCATYFVW